MNKTQSRVGGGEKFKRWLYQIHSCNSAIRCGGGGGGGGGELDVRSMCDYKLPRRRRRRGFLCGGDPKIAMVKRGQ